MTDFDKTLVELFGETEMASFEMSWHRPYERKDDYDASLPFHRRVPMHHFNSYDPTL